jgi:hypothetical protein
MVLNVVSRHHYTNFPFFHNLMFFIPEKPPTRTSTIIHISDIIYNNCVYRGRVICNILIYNVNISYD